MSPPDGSEPGAGQASPSAPAIGAWIEEVARRRPQAPFLEDARSTRVVTYGALAARVEEWRRFLDEGGNGSYPAIGLCIKDHLDYAVTLVCLLAAGRTVVPLDPRAPTHEQMRTLAAAGAPWCVVERAPSDGSLRPAAMDGEAAPSAVQSGPAVVMCSSGTTGAPKTIRLVADQLCHVAWKVASHHGLGPEDRGFCPLPLFHINAEVVGLLGTLIAEATLVLDDRFHRTGFWELMAARRITWINAVPAIIAVLASTSQTGITPNSVRFVRSASAPLPVETLLRFEQAAGLAVVETYGMTEAASMICANPVDGVRKPGSVGPAVGAELRVVDRRRRRCEPGRIGRVEIRGAGIITAYEAGGPADAFDREHWLDTKDLGYLDDDGYLFLVGRADDVINRGGENIYPREVEEVLLADPSVQSVAVTGEPDPVLGARPVAYVVADAAVVSPAALLSALRERCREQLSPFKVPVEIYLVAALPTGPTGKLLRRKLGELSHQSELSHQLVS